MNVSGSSGCNDETVTAIPSATSQQQRHRSIAEQLEETRNALWIAEIERRFFEDKSYVAQEKLHATQEELQTTKLELKDVREELESVQSATTLVMATSTSGDINKFQAELGTLRSAYDRLQMEQQQSLQNAHAIFQKEVQAMSVANDTLQKELNDMRCSFELEDKVKDAKIRNLETQMQVKGNAELAIQLLAENRRKEYDRNVSIIQAELQVLRDENATLQNNVSRLQADNYWSQEKLITLNDEASNGDGCTLRVANEKLQEELLTLRDINEKLQEELQALRDDNKKLHEKQCKLLQTDGVVLQTEQSIQYGEILFHKDQETELDVVKQDRDRLIVKCKSIMDGTKPTQDDLEESIAVSFDHEEVNDTQSSTLRRITQDRNDARQLIEDMDLELHRLAKEVDYYERLCDRNDTPNGKRRRKVSM